MPIEIKELIVKITINERKSTSTDKIDASISQNIIKKIVDECTEKVLEKIEAKFER